MRPPESFLEQPVRSLQTMLRVIALDDPRLPKVIPDGIYGPSTMYAVTAFQRREGLPVTGITDEATWNQIVRMYDDASVQIQRAQPIEILIDPGEVFQYGQSSPYIYLLQSMLTQLSMDHPTIYAPGHTGIMDDATTQSLTAFQALAGLAQTGELDRITWKNVVLQFTLSVHHQNAAQNAAK